MTVELALDPSRVKSIRAFDPDLPGSTGLPYTRKGTAIEFVLPPIRIYKLVEVDLKPGS